MKSIITSLLFIAFFLSSSHGQVAICTQDLTVALDGNGEATIPVSVFDEGSYDYDALTVSQSYFTCNDIGTLQVTLTATKDGNVNTCTTNVTIQDKLAPFVVCQPYGAVVLPLIGGTATLTPEMLVQTAYDNCGIASMTASETSFDGSVSTPLVDLTVTDGANLSATCATIIQIGGVYQAYLNCKSNVEFAILPNENRIVELEDILLNGPFPSWNLDLVITDSGNNVVLNNELSGNNAGQTYTAVASDPVTGASCMTLITIVEPFINCVAGLNYDLLPWTNSLELYVSDLDDGSSAFDSMWLSQYIFDCDDLGANEVTLSGQIGSTVYQCTTIVTLNDNTPPVAICDANIYLALDANGQATLTAGLVDDGSFDNCSIDTMMIDKTQFDTSSNPIEVVRLDVVDGTGNTTSCWVNVHILGVGTPNLVCNNNVVVGLPISGSYVPDVEILLEGGPYFGWDIDYILIDQNNDTIPNNEITTDYLNQSITFVVFDNQSSASCSGTLFVDGTIPNDCTDFFICDTKPWNTPVGDCSSGHTLEDFVEWPDNIDIADCYYSPNYLENFTGVGYRNARPQLVGNCDFKAIGHSDEVFTYPNNKIKVLRKWLVVDWITVEIWRYTQILNIDLANCATPIIVRNINEQGIQHVNVYESVLTDDQGEAIINSNQYNSLSATHMGTIRDGVDLHDQLAIQEYINGQRALSDLQKSLADVNKDNDIDSRDLAEIRNIAFEIIDPTTQEPWLFYGAKGDPIDDIDKPVLAGDYYGGPVEIIGAKRGDINGDASNNGQIEQSAAEVDIELFIKDELLFDEVAYSVDFSIEDLENIGGQQLELVIDLNKVDIRSVTSPAFPSFSNDNYKITNNNILLIYWSATNSDIINGGTSGSRNIPILSIDLVAKQNSILSTAIWLNQSQRNTIARVGDDTRYAFNIKWIDKIFSNTSNPEVGAHHVTIAPNPGDDNISIAVDNAQHEFLTLNVYNSLRQLKEQNTIENGQISIRTHAWDNGIYLYKISNEKGLSKTGLFSVQH